MIVWMGKNFILFKNNSLFCTTWRSSIITAYVDSTAHSTEQFSTNSCFYPPFIKRFLFCTTRRSSTITTYLDSTAHSTEQCSTTPAFTLHFRLLSHNLSFCHSVFHHTIRIKLIFCKNAKIVYFIALRNLLIFFI